MSADAASLRAEKLFAANVGSCNVVVADSAFDVRGEKDSAMMKTRLADRTQFLR